MRLSRVLLRATVAALLAMFCAVAPLAEWAPGWVQQVQAPVAVVVLICYCGKVLYDTFFFDHFRP
jgi:hypothetical protein